MALTIVLHPQAPDVKSYSDILVNSLQRYTSQAEAKRKESEPSWNDEYSRIKTAQQQAKELAAFGPRMRSYFLLK